MHESMVLEVFHVMPKTFTRDLSEQVENALSRAPQLCGCTIQCEQRNDTAVLRGRVPSYYLKQIAQTVAGDVDGVERVVNEIDVVADRLHCS